MEEARTGNWTTLNFKSSSELPSYFKSIITPAGEIYLTGGSNGTSLAIQASKNTTKSTNTTSIKILFKSQAGWQYSAPPTPSASQRTPSSSSAASRRQKAKSLDNAKPSTCKLDSAQGSHHSTRPPPIPAPLPSTTNLSSSSEESTIATSTKIAKSSKCTPLRIIDGWQSPWICPEMCPHYNCSVSVQLFK